LPFMLLLSAAKPGAAAHGAGFAAATDLAALLVLRAPLEAALRHVPVDLGAAKVHPGAHDVNGRLLAALQGTDDFVDDAVIDQRLQAFGNFHGLRGRGLSAREAGLGGMREKRVENSDGDSI